LKHVKYIFNKSTVILRQNLTEKFAKKVNAGSNKIKRKNSVFAPNLYKLNPSSLQPYGVNLSYLV